MTTHYLDDTQPHAFWDNSYPARIHAKSGDTVVFETLEASACQITPASQDEAVAHLDFGLIHPLTGPVYVEGAEPGDGLEVEVISIKHKNWGWNAVIPGFGLLGEDFPNPYLHHYKLGRTHCEFRKDILIPYEPFCGVMGVAPREPGRLNTIPPRENAGNIDIRHLTPGTRVTFPVLETPMKVRLRFHVMKGANTPELRFITLPGKKLTVTDEKGYFVTTAHGPDLFQDAQRAIRYMINYLASEYNMTREQAYCLCGATVDLKISEIVDAPNWIVSAYLPLSIFKGSKPAAKSASRSKSTKPLPKRAIIKRRK